MESFKPQYYIETRFEKVNGYHYPQPVEYCNGKEYKAYPEESYERKNWGELYWQSYSYNYFKKVSRYDENIWVSDEIRDKAFTAIYLNPDRDKGEGEYTALREFEVYLLNKGYEIKSFDRMNAMNPCFSLAKDKEGYKGVMFTRVYKHPAGRTLCFAFGIKSPVKEFNFYFVDKDNPGYYQVPARKQDFEAAENLQGVSL